MVEAIDDRFVIPDHNPDEGYYEDRVFHIADKDAEVSEEGSLLWGYDEEEDRRIARRKQVLCSRGRWVDGDDLTIATAADRYGFKYDTFAAEPPDDICTYCWRKAREIVEEEQEGQPDEIGAVGYRIRWKQKHRAREEWYDIVIRPTATVQDLDAHLRRFSTIGGFHLRLYGLEGEYEDSSLGILPDKQYEKAGDGTQKKASSTTIGQLATKDTLWEGDRLTMACDLATPSYYYGIIKDALRPAEIDELFDTMAEVEEDAPAAVVKSKDPEDGSIYTDSAWPPTALREEGGGSESDDGKESGNQESVDEEAEQSKNRVHGVGSGKADTDHDPIEEWSIRNDVK